MIVEAFILCFNEEKMIEHTLNHYTHFCHKVTIIDNQSTDNSIAIVKEKFPDVIIEELDTGGEYREDIQIWIRNNKWKESDADFVIMADMDEFIADPKLLEKLEDMKRQNIAIPNIIGYNMFSKTFPENYGVSILDQVKQGFKDPQFNKSIIFSPKLIKAMNFGPGSHFCNPQYHEGVDPNTDHSIELTLLHFKYLGRAYLYDKHHSYASRMSEVNRHYKFGYEYELGNDHVDNLFDKIETFIETN